MFSLPEMVRRRPSGWDDTIIEKWRAAYRPNEASTTSIEAVLAEGYILPTTLKATYKGKARSVIYVRWSNFRPMGPDLERRVRLMECIAFVFDMYWSNSECDILVAYDYNGWGPSQSEPSRLADVVNLIGRYGFDMYHCIVNAPVVFTPLWYTIKMILPSYIIEKCDFIKNMPDGITHEAAVSSCADWFKAIKPKLMPEAFQSPLRKLYTTDLKARAGGTEFEIYKAGSNNLLSRSATDFKLRYFRVLASGDGLNLAYSTSKGFEEMKKVYMLDGAQWTPLSKTSNAKFAFQISCVDGQVLNLATQTEEDANEFLLVCGLRG